MDLSKFKTSDWLKVGGAVLMLIAGFLTWWQPDCGGIAECEAFVDAAGLDVTAFDLTFSGLFPWILLVAIGILTFLSASGLFKLPANIPAPLIFLVASAYSALFVIGRLLIDPYEGDVSDAVERGIGLYLAVVAVIAVLAGSYMGFKESGGDLGDLTDMDKMKGSFGGGSTPPPPPPPAG